MGSDQSRFVKTEEAYVAKPVIRRPYAICLSLLAMLVLALLSNMPSHVAQKTALQTVATSPRAVLKPIEQIHVGERVAVAENPESLLTIP